jgi:ribosomal protein L12E/L44/L45/RPP1/RPP2
VQADNINTLVKAAGLTVEPYWPSLFAKLFAKKSVEDLITNIGSGVWTAPPAAVASRHRGSIRSSSATAAKDRYQQQPAQHVCRRCCALWCSWTVHLQPSQATRWCICPLGGGQLCLGQQYSSGAAVAVTIAGMPMAGHATSDL